MGQASQQWHDGWGIEPRRHSEPRNRSRNVFSKPPSGRSYKLKLEPGLLKSLSLAHSATESHQFWVKYEEIASDFDQRFISRLENGVDVSMLFAGLFSAVNTAFIIATQTNIVALNSSNATVANIVNAGGLVFSLGWTTALSYASLSTSLLAAFGALLAKQWLAHFRATRSNHGSLSSCGVYRQRKFDVMQHSYFNTILDCVPVLLEVSLLLFAVALLGQVWYPSRNVAGIILTATSIGVALYFVTFFAAMLTPDSPFQTLPSQLTQMFLDFLFHLPQSLSVIQRLVLCCRTQIAALPHYLGVSHSNPKFVPLPTAALSQEAPAVRWLLQISTDPVVVTAVATMVPEVDWPVDFNLDVFIKPLLEAFESCFKVERNDHGVVSLSCFDSGRAYTCSKGLCHLYAEILYGGYAPDSELQDSLASLRSCFSFSTNLRPHEHRIAFICALIGLMIEDPASSPSIDVPEGELSWISHIIPAFLHTAKPKWIGLAASSIAKVAPYEPMPSKVLADHWVMIALVLGMQINPNDLVKVDKSSIIDVIREEVCAFIEPGPPRRKPVVKKTQAYKENFVLALDLILRVLGEEQDRGMITKADLEAWIVNLYGRLTNGDGEGDSSDIWKTNWNGCAILKAMFRSVDQHTLLRSRPRRRSSECVLYALERFVELRDTETVGLVLPLWLGTTPDCFADAGFDAIMLLLCSNNPRWCLVAFRSTIEGLDSGYLGSWRGLLQTNEGKFKHLIDMLLQPLHMIDTDTSAPASAVTAEDRFNMAVNYLRVVARMAQADAAFFHTHLLAHGHLQQSVNIQSNSQVSEGGKAKRELDRLECSFLLLLVVALAIGACSRLGCIEAAAHPSINIVRDYPLEKQTVLSALQYIQGTSELDAEHITYIAEYIKFIHWPLQDVPQEFRTDLEARLNRGWRSGLRLAFIQLLNALGFDTPTPSE